MTPERKALEELVAAQDALPRPMQAGHSEWVDRMLDAWEAARAALALPVAPPTYTLAEIADACIAAEVSDAQFRSITIALGSTCPGCGGIGDETREPAHCDVCAGCERGEPAGHALAMVQAQAEDAGLWLPAASVVEDYLQAALRRLHAAVEADARGDPVRSALREMVDMMDSGDEHGAGSPWHQRAKAALADGVRDTSADQKGGA